VQILSSDERAEVEAGTPNPPAAVNTAGRSLR